MTALNKLNIEPRSNAVFIANVRHLMNTRNISEAELARQTQIPQPTLHKILAGKTTDPRISTLQILATYFGITVDELFTGAKAYGLTTHPEIQSIPIISWTDCIQEKSLLDHLNPSNWEQWLVIEHLAKQPYALISKPCMEPRFPKGTALIIDPDTSPKDGDLIVVHYPNTTEATLRELSIDGPIQLLIPISPDHEKDKLTNEIKILGVVLQSRFSY